MPREDDEQWLRELEERFRDLPDARIHEELERWRPDTAPRRILLEILAERQHAAQAPETERFEQTYEQTERHHSKAQRQAFRAEIIAWIALGISAVALLQQCTQSQQTP